LNRITTALAAVENARIKPPFNSWRLVVELPDGSLGYLRLEFMSRECWEREPRDANEWTLLDAGDNVVLLACDW